MFRRSLPRLYQARLAQLVERKALNLVVVGSSPTVGVFPPASCGAPVLSFLDWDMTLKVPPPGLEPGSVG